MTIRLWPSTLAVFLVLAVPAVAQTCTVSITPINFGTYSPYASVALDSTGQVSVDCGGAGSAVVSLNPGVNGGGSFMGRSLGNGQSQLHYQLYSDGAYTQVWGDGTGGSTTASVSGSGTLTMYGRVPAHQNVTAGLYTDTVLLTITY